MLDRIALAATAFVAFQGLAFAQGAPLQLGQKPGAAATAAIQNAASPARVASPDAATSVRRANAYFNGITSLIGDFVQTSADGRRINGKLYMQKPGRLRFEYASPSPLEIVADGTSVAIRNRKLNTQDVYFIAQTPLKFLLKQNLDLARDTKILEISNQPDSTSIRIEDKATLGGTSRITLTFKSNDFSLIRWSVNDPQGNDTTVTLANVDLTQRPDSSMFLINYERQDSN